MEGMMVDSPVDLMDLFHHGQKFLGARNEPNGRFFPEKNFL